MRACKVRAGGNLGPPALELLDASAELYVLELSSFQLETARTLHCRAATVLNVTPDHLDRYPSLASYAAAKARIFARCDTAVINLDDPLVAAMPHAAPRTLGFSLRASVGADYALAMHADRWWLMHAAEPLLPVAQLKIRGAHNAANALAALALGDALDLPRAAMLAELTEFAGLPHRSQWVAAVNGVSYIDDSKGTNVGATLAAVAGMPGPLVMIAGGEGKDQDFSPLRRGVPRQGAPHRADRTRCAAAGARARRGVHARDLHDAAAGGAGRGARGAPRGYGAALAGVREPRHVPRLRAARQGIRPGRAGARSMSAGAASLGFARSSGRSGALHLDTVTLALTLALMLLGLVMVTSASVSIASQDTGQPFDYLERQLLLTLIGAGCALLMFSLRIELLERAALPLLALALGLLFIVLIPGLGHAVNGSRRWLHLAGANFQVSELARVLVLIYVASYAVRRENELRSSLAGLVKPLGLLVLASILLLAEPDFGAATVLFASGFGLLFLAGARLRYVIAMMALAAVGFGALAVSSSYRVRRLTAFLDPWADPYNSGFQLTQSLIAIGRGQGFGVGLGDSVQKLFYLPEAHTDFLFAVLAEELGLLGVVLTLALFLGLIWRAFRIARLAADAGLKFAAYLAAGFGLWLGIQAFINIGVNMGVLPTKGLTLPLMSYGRSSLIVALAWVGLLLRVYHEASAAARGSATVREAA